MSSPSSPFYATSLPSPNDLVVVEITRIDPERGVWTQLLEYGGVQGFLSTKEITTKRLLRITDHIRVGATEVMCVAAVDGDAIDLTRKHIEPDEAEAAMIRFKLTRSIRQWLEHCDVGSTEERAALTDAIRAHGYKDALAGPSELCLAARAHLSLEEKPQIHAREFTFAPTHPMRHNPHIGHLNAFLADIKAAHPVELTVTDSREGRYLITSRDKMLAAEFEAMFGAAVSHLWSIPTEIPTPAPEVLPADHVNVQPTVNVGLIGHVAHGKTSITQVISGVDTRRHKREIMTNRTLKLGYTNARITRCVCVPAEPPAYLSGATCSCPSVHLSIIDCPGHNVLLSTMISGTHLMDTCLLVVAANEECPQFQTREHMDIVHIVNKATNVVCLQNKVDLMDDAGLQASRAQITKFLTDTGLDTHAVIPVSAQKEVNTDVLLEYLYEWVSRHGAATKLPTQTATPTAVVVRTFDITRPGDRNIKGLVLGGSVLSGSFALGDEIILMPQGIRTHILSLKSDKNALSVAVAGGLIAVGTDLNPCLADSLVGTTIIHARDYQPAQLVTEDFHIYYRGINKHSYPKRGDKVLLNVLANEVTATVRKVSHDDKHSIRLTLAAPLYIHAADVKFTVCQGGRLIGYGCPWDGRKAAAEPPRCMFDIPRVPAYDDLLVRARDQLSEFTVHRTTLPAPVVEFANKYTTIVNFGTLCDILKAPHSEAGEYLRSELGLESWSVNKRQQLLMRGCTNMQRVMSVLRKYAAKRMCSKCRSLDTELCMDRGVRKQRCATCGWMELPKEG